MLLSTIGSLGGAARTDGAGRRKSGGSPTGPWRLPLTYTLRAAKTGLTRAAQPW